MMFDYSNFYVYCILMTPLSRPMRSLTLLSPLACPLLGVTPAACANGEGPMNWLESEALTGDWWGHRSRFEDAGFSLGAAYTAEFSSVLRGGVQQAGSFRNLFTLDATIDFERVLGVHGGLLFAQFLSVDGESGGSADSGDLQVYSNIESERSLDTIYELWIEQHFFSDRLRVKAGKIDANSEFAFVEIAGDFANSSAGFSPTLVGFPTYPDPATGVGIFATLYEGERWTASGGYGFFDGALGVDGVPTGRRGPQSFFSSRQSDDYFHVGQIELDWHSLSHSGILPSQGRFSFGGWWHTGDFERFDGDNADGTGGLFMTAEARLLDFDTPSLIQSQDHQMAPANSQLDASQRGLYAFVQAGVADDAVSEVAWHLGGGVVARGPIAARPHDSAGLYLSHAALSEDGPAGPGASEFVADAFYRLQLTPAIFVQPELQYIVNPSGRDDLDDALVAGLRIGVTF